MTADRTASMSKLLPPSLGSLFGQPLETAPEHSTLPDPPADLPGAHAAPELCCIVDQYHADLLPREAIGEVKLDGIRAVFITGRLWTREGSPIEAAEHCLPILRAMEAAYGVPMVFDGEYVEDGGLEATISAFRSRNGNGVLWLFDAVPFDEWKSGKPSRRPLVERKLKLRRVLLDVTERCQGVPVGYVEHGIIRNAGDVETFAQMLWREGYEGLVVKAADSLYLRRRTCDWMKVKLRTVSTMQVVDVLGCRRKVEVASAAGRIVEERECAKTLLVRLPGRDKATGQPCRAMRLPVGAGGLSETLLSRRPPVLRHRAGAKGFNEANPGRRQRRRGSSVPAAST
jgi:hypothetical protein